MRALLLFTLLLLTACNGNWSNEDLEYAGALPSRETLRSELPTSASSMMGLKRDPLLGEASKAYLDTKGASDQFNGLVDFVTMVLDAVVKYPPTARTPDSRTWGPWDDPNNPGKQFRVVITRGTVSGGVGDLYAWSIDTGDRGAELTAVATGHYQPTDSISRGEGDFIVNAKKIRDETPNSMDPNPVDEIDVVYDTRLIETPKKVQMTFAFTPGGQSNLSTGGYRYQQELDGSGTMRFDTKGGTAEISAASNSSKWVKSGAGRALLRVEAGLYTGLESTECWDDAFKVVFSRQNWPGGVTEGVETACAIGP